MDAEPAKTGDRGVGIQGKNWLVAKVLFICNYSCGCDIKW